MMQMLSDKAEEVSSQEQAVDYLEQLSGAIPSLNIECFDVESYVSAISGFLEDFSERADMSPGEYRRLCLIIFESLFYE